MNSAPNFLFPDLPPELRNEIYTYLSTPCSNSRLLNLQLPLQLKTFTCKHTTVQICPVHHGSTGLLALPRDQFLEAREYQSWLLNNALELQVSVHFKGRIHTFTQAHWDKKMEAHLRKLGKLHPWLKKVPKYNIQVLWDPVDGVLKSKNNKRIAGHVPLDMAKTLTQLMDPDVKRKQGCVQLGLHLNHKFAVENAMASCKLGLDVFLANENRLLGFRALTREVWKAPCTFTSLESTLPNLPSSALRMVPLVAPQDNPLMTVDEGVVRWSACTKGRLVMRKKYSSMAAGSDVVYEYGHGEMKFPVCQILAECVSGL